METWKCISKPEENIRQFQLLRKKYKSILKADKVKLFWSFSVLGGLRSLRFPVQGCGPAHLGANRRYSKIHRTLPPSTDSLHLFGR